MAKRSTKNAIASRAGRGKFQGGNRIAARPIREQAGVLLKRRLTSASRQKTVQETRAVEWQRMAVPAAVTMGAMASTSNELVPIAGLPSIDDVFPEFGQGEIPTMGAMTASTSYMLAPISGLPSIYDVFPGLCPGSEPLPLPDTNRRAVPKFEICGQQNCGKHPELHPWWQWPYPATTCYKCLRQSTPNELHALPCGHALCHGCLEQTVAEINANVQHESSWAEISTHLEEHWAASSPNGGSGQLDSRQPILNSSPLDRAMAAAGFHCCGKNMHLERYAMCMTPHTVRTFWLACEAIRWPLDMARNRCGWPDCGRLVSPTCSYVRNHGTVYHCLYCQGNSYYICKTLPLPKSKPQRKSLPAPGPPKEDPIPIANNVSPLPLWQRLGPLTRAAEGYARAQRNRPYVTQVCSSLVIALCADLSVQRMSAWVAEKEVVPTDSITPTSSSPLSTYSYDPVRTARSLVIGAIFAIPTYRWFIFLSRNFNYSSHIFSLTVKIVVNQLCYTPVFNSYFFGMQALLAGDTPQEAFDRVRRTVPISFVNALKLWPAVTAFSFTFVPMEYRSVFSGVIAVGWQTINTNRSVSTSPHSEAGVSAPSTQTPGSEQSQPVSRLRSAFWITSISLSVFATYLYATDTRASVHRWLVPRLLRLIYTDAEEAHHIGTQSMKILYQLGLHPRDRTDDEDSQKSTLATTVFEEPDSLALNNPIGISAGLDKNADIPDALFALGAAVVEVGGCTPRPQAGNSRPRAFRVPAIEGFVNRYGLNSIGADALASRLRARVRQFCRDHAEKHLTEADVLSGAAGVPPGSLSPGRLLLVQIAKNKDTDERDVRAVAEDYTYCVRRLAPYADVIVVNVSSPNTPGLRDLQAVEPLTRILGAVVDETRKSANKLTAMRTIPTRVMVKVSPDEDSDSQIDGICEAVWASGVDGIIVGNTTKRRTGLIPEKLRIPVDQQRALAETGGFSGPAMYGRTLALVKRYRQRLDEQALHLTAPMNKDNVKPVARKALFASGGVTTGNDALNLLNAGASVAMVYTGLVYGGAGTITRVKQELRDEIACFDVKEKGI
ncbi:dihydroorotate reductase [Grosmannia clavigera kw1407]|uniref:Dihydroorotate reductase n=1 Tax=Grosmannia clavigera (strain kw1407 / UAMH 11150) TaxID=655863 RepID=F0X877_GROCL|nr:dihydroorotate reductase [Grosmannia clavigera kw1407]EFX05469.1 dihydroorotate reductase [Grosmannia clavigera kw1407]